MKDTSESIEFYKITKKAVVIAIIIAIIITGYLLFFNKDQYSSLYIIPESYQKGIENESITFIYGVVCSEKSSTNYSLNIYVNNKIVQTEHFQLEDSEDYQKKVELPLEMVDEYPAKIQLILANGNVTENAHFWVENGQEPYK